MSFLWLDRLISKAFAWRHAQWNDQVQYLNEVYQAYTVGQESGFWKGLAWAFSNPAAQGGLHDVLGYLVVSVAGPSRSAVLSLNILFFMGLQLAWLYVSDRRGWGRAGTFWVLALCWLWATPWRLAAGTIVDFRLDFIAACAWGIALAAATCTRGFESRRASVVFGLALGLAVSARFLAVAYATGVLLVFLVWILCSGERRARLITLSIAAVVAGATAAPFMLPNFREIYLYYLVGHFTGGESSIRAAGLGFVQSAQQVWRWAYQLHVGPPLVIVLLAGCGWSVWSWWMRRQRTSLPTQPADRPLDFLIPTAAFAVVPYLILATHRQSSAVVESILAPAFIAAALFVWNAVPAKGRGGTVVLAAAIATAVWSGFRVHAAFDRELKDTAKRAELRQIITFADAIYHDYSEHPRSPLRIGVNRVTDALDGQILRLTIFERHKRWLPIHMVLPTGIAADDEGEILRRVRESDFLFLTPQAERAGYYPYDRQMNELTAKVDAAAAEHLQVLSRFNYQGREWTFLGRRR